MSTSLIVQNVKASVGWDFEQTNSFGTNSQNIASFSFAPTSWTNGSGTGKAQYIYMAALTIAGSTTTDLGLTATSSNPVKDIYGNNLTFADIKLIYIQHATSTATGVLKVTGDFLALNSGSPPILLGGTTPTGNLEIQPGGCFFLCNGGGTGYTVTATTQDTLSLDNTDTSSITVNVCLIGE